MSDRIRTRKPTVKEMSKSVSKRIAAQKAKKDAPKPVVQTTMDKVLATVMAEPIPSEIKKRPRRHNEQLLQAAEELEKVLALLRIGGPSNDEEKQQVITSIQDAVDKIR